LFSYIIKRLLLVIPVLFVVSIVIFSIVYITPGNPAAILLGMEATAEGIENLSRELGFDRPFYQQYLSWILNVLKGDLGNSIFMQQPVLQAIVEHFPPTISLALFSQTIAILIAIPVGILSAYKRGSVLDTAMTVISLFGIAIPGFLLGLFLMLIFGVELNWLPVAGYRRISDGLWDHVRYLILPGISLGTVQVALIMRMTRSAMLDVLGVNYIKTARAKGLREVVVVAKHGLKNAGIPILAVVGQSFANLMTGAVVVESLFNIPGIGRLVLNAIERRDIAVIQGVVLLITLVYVIINLVVDLLYGIIDVRIRLKNE